MGRRPFQGQGQQVSLLTTHSGPIQVKSGTIFDNFLITNDEAYAEEFGNETWGVTKAAEKQMKDKQDEEQRIHEEEEEKKGKEEEEADKDDDKDKDEDEEEEDAAAGQAKDEL